MKKYKIIGICQIYNEVEKCNLRRFLKYILPLVDDLVVYDDGSTDGSYEYVLKHTPYVIRSAKNDFADEVNHRNLMLKKALKLKPDFILWLDADEVLSAGAKKKLQKLCQYCEANKLDAIDFHELNIWRSSTYRRIDSLYDIGWFPRLWRVVPSLGFGGIKRGLHQAAFMPSSIEKKEQTNELAVLHYGFADELNLAYKYLIYRAHGQRGYEKLDRLINEDRLKLERVPKQMFPKGLWKPDDKEPKPLSFIESLAYVEKLKEKVFRPKYSIVCLIYKSVDWLKFVYEQVLKYTDMTDKEFYFVANDANDEVINYLKDNYIPHYIFHNTAKQRKEWYINNVYRAWNYAAKVAKGDFIVFINSDMAFTPDWLDNLINVYNGGNCIAPRLVESGKLKSGTYGMEKDFGRSYSSYKERAFQKYAASISKNTVKNGGLYMPLLIRKEHLGAVGGYPEGNVKPGNDIFHAKIAQKGEEVIPGDVILMEKLKTIGINHRTAFNSVVYHSQCGEMDEENLSSKHKDKARIAICNDLLTGIMGEKVLWDYLIESLPGAYGVDKRVVKRGINFEQKARHHIKKHYPDTKIIIQNATFMGRIDSNRYTIAFLQDDLRAMGRKSAQQEANLKTANKIVANSVQTALSYSDFDCEIIPIGVDSELFRPLDKKRLRAKHSFGKEKIGIFVGNFSEVKGWSKIKQCIKNHPEITWILVSKDKENYEAKNVKVYNRIDQKLLAELLNCADFFIIGSPVETLCLAAVEACFCDVPVVMPNIGIFKHFSNEDREKLGIFGADLELGIKNVFKGKFSPRDLILQKGLTIQDSIKKWQELLQDIILEMNIQKIRCKIKTNYREKILKLLFGKKKLGKIYQKYIQIKSRWLKYFFRTFFYKHAISAVRRIAQEGYGSDECLKQGYLPVPVHYYSPIPDIVDLEKRKIWDKKSPLSGIDFNQIGQLELLKKLGQKFGQECNFPLNPTKNPAEFYADNNSFGYGCAVALHSIIREFQPHKVIEVGSGYSSLVIAQALQMNKKNQSQAPQYLIVDPYPAEHVAKKLIKYNRLFSRKVELLKPIFFDQLKKNDILFIDSSHTSKIGSDVNFLYLDVLPRLKPGVIVHIHDINLPYEYQKVYATNEVFRQFWTEQYLLQAFLIGNKNYEILLGMWYLMTDHLSKFKAAFPSYNPQVHKYTSGSFWIRRK